VGFGDCTFVQWDKERKGLAAIQAASGTVLVRGCEFQEDKPQIELAVGVRRAIVAENIVRGKLRVTNQSKGSVHISDNASDE
jgi:hypothetical protein